VKQEGGRAALFCVLSQSTLEREIWRGRIAWNRSGGRPATKCVVTGSKPWGTCEKTLTRREATARLKRHSAFGSTSFKLLEEPAAQPAAAGCGLLQCQTGGGFSRKAKATKQTDRRFSNLQQIAVAVGRALKAPDNRVGCLVLLRPLPRFARFSAACSRSRFLRNGQATMFRSP
jgi:hypothetical protein